MNLVSIYLNLKLQYWKKNQYQNDPGQEFFILA